MATPYDEVPYRSYPFAQSHPNRLATIASLLGMVPADPAKSRILELACASGGNLLPMAEQYPEAELVGVDASETQIAAGQGVVDALGLRNVRILHQDIRELDERLGEFDYIIAHGVFSWVPNDVRLKILEICRRNLKPQGVAYVSYNAYPGWRFRGMIRDVMAYRGKFFDSPEERLQEARSLVQFLARSVPTENNPYGILLNEELKHLKTKEDYYLLHEYLEEVNSPLYFHEFWELADQQGLQYLGEANYNMMSVNNFPKEVADRLKQIASHVVQKEQYMDFVRNRMFRQTLLCHKGVMLQRDPAPERVFAMSIATDAKPEKDVPNPNSREKITFTRPGSTMTTAEPLMKAAMLHLRDIWPRTVPFRELIDTARGRLSEGPSFVNAEQDQKDSLALAEPLLRCYATSHIDLTRFPLNVNLDISATPRASLLARHQAESTGEVTNLWHQTTKINDLQRQILGCLDGSTDRTGIIAALTAAIQSGKMAIHEKGRPVTEVERVAQIMDSVIDENLLALAKKGLLHHD
jgi:methyltransferase-like protein